MSKMKTTKGSKQQAKWFELNSSRKQFMYLNVHEQDYIQIWNCIYDILQSSFKYIFGINKDQIKL
jgi:serine phosphatase RsbU (regulator of sigma subunit)